MAVRRHDRALQKTQGDEMDEQEREYAGFWARFGAFVIDTILLLAITVPLTAHFYGWQIFSDPDAPFIKGPADILINWIFPLTAVFLFWRYKQATPGKMALSIRIVDAKTGGPMSVGQIIGRYFAYFVSVLPLCIGFLWIAFDPKKQGWHDKLAGTVLVRGGKSAGPDQ
jgi:uncharacterized RDD family membrane protein YckC